MTSLPIQRLKSMISDLNTAKIDLNDVFTLNIAVGQFRQDLPTAMDNFIDHFWRDGAV